MTIRDEADFDLKMKLCQASEVLQFKDSVITNRISQSKTSEEVKKPNYFEKRKVTVHKTQICPKKPFLKTSVT